MFDLGLPELIIILVILLLIFLVILLLIFGSKKLPKLAKSLGESAGELQKGFDNVGKKSKNENKDKSDSSK